MQQPIICPCEQRALGNQVLLYVLDGILLRQADFSKELLIAEQLGLTIPPSADGQRLLAKACYRARILQLMLPELGYPNIKVHLPVDPLDDAHLVVDQSSAAALEKHLVQFHFTVRTKIL